MISFLKFLSRRHGHDGWAAIRKGATEPLYWTASTTREEVRELRESRPDLFWSDMEIVKVKIRLEVVK